MPTCVDGSSVQVTPRKSKGQAILPIEGRSILPAQHWITGRSSAGGTLLEHEGRRGHPHVGDWKLVRLGRNGPWEPVRSQDGSGPSCTDQAVARPELMPRNWPRSGGRLGEGAPHAVKPYPKWEGDGSFTQARKHASERKGSLLRLRVRLVSFATVRSVIIEAME